MNKFLELREKYPKFIYKNYTIKQEKESLTIMYNFEIPDLAEFHPTLTIPIKNQTNYSEDVFFNYLVFHHGLIEMMSYFKATCSPNIIIEAGYINEEQIKWFKNLFYNGLGEFLYINNITVSEKDLVTITCIPKEKKISIPAYEGQGNLIPIGGGKDSCVSLEILKNMPNNSCFIINPKPITLACAHTANYEEENIIGVKRTIDKRLLELNNEGFLNGHTPFSSMLAFYSYMTAYIYKKKYIILSNESSANESTVLGTTINHQYSKTIDFENDFQAYTKKYFQIDLTYFSLLRPLSEFQIGMLFSNYKKYHPIFKSCNVGSKEQEWKWCCNCPKCLFVFILLSPFLYKEELISIFKEDLFTKENLLSTFLELLGYAETKPFECVGTYEEVRYATSLTIKKLQNKNLPLLLEYYKKYYPLELEHDFKHAFYTNNVPEEYLNLVRKELNTYAK